MSCKGFNSAEQFFFFFFFCIITTTSEFRLLPSHGYKVLKTLIRPFDVKNETSIATANCVFNSYTERPGCKFIHQCLGPHHQSHVPVASMSRNNPTSLDCIKILDHVNILITGNFFKSQNGNKHFK